LLVDQRARAQCFAAAETQPVDAHWSLVRGAVDPTCIERGRLSAALFYEPAKADDEGKDVPAYAAVTHPRSAKR